MSDYLIEIGAEELPSNQVEPALDQFEASTKKLLEENNVSFDNIKKLATSRRLTLIINALKVDMSDETEEIKGPAVKICFDENGDSTKALQGFMKSQGIKESDLIRKTIKDTEYVFANVKIKKNSIEEILQDIISKAIRSIVFPRSMRWGGKNLKFARPIRWLLSLLDDTVVTLDLEGISVSNDTYGHRFLSPGKITIFNVADYEEKLAEAGVIVDQKDRKALIKSEVEKAAKEHGGNVEKDEKLLNEINYLVEHPVALSGKIKDRFMSLPPEVIVTPMKFHLRFFPVLDDEGKLMPYFISVANNGEEYVDIVREGNEKVLDPRLEDAEFFYNEDTKIPLEEYSEKLKRVLFHEKLGTLYQKVDRLRQISKKYGEYLSIGEEQLVDLDRAAQLSKCDLVSRMVEEFTELQGVMGKRYAEKSGEKEIVSKAIMEQYLPRFAGDDLPKTTSGTVLSLADKFDTISGMFAVGIKPTGSVDQFGLRRAAIGILNILLEKNIRLHLEDFVMDSLYAYVDVNGLVFDYNDVKKEIEEFFKGRFKNILSAEGIRYDIIESVINLPETFVEIRSRAKFINDEIDSKSFKHLLSGYNRIKFMAEKSEDNKFDENILEDSDKVLLEIFKEKKSAVEEALEIADYQTVIVSLASLEDRINQYMDEVMILVDYEALKNSRLGLLKTMRDEFNKFADFAAVVEQ